MNITHFTVEYIWIFICSFQKVKSVDDYLTANNRMKMFAKLEIGEVVIQISLNENRYRREYLMLRLDGFSTELAYTVWINNNNEMKHCGVAVHACLRGIRMADKLHTG